MQSLQLGEQCIDLLGDRGSDRILLPHKLIRLLLLHLPAQSLDPLRFFFFFGCHFSSLLLKGSDDASFRSLQF